MVLLGIASLLLLYITLGLGIFTVAILEKILRQPISSNILGVLLSGLIFSTFFFSLVSFWAPVNYFSLIPLFVVSSLVYIKKNITAKSLLSAIRQNVQLIFRRSNLLLTVPALIVLSYYWMVPPMNIDSGGYHYITIHWLENYKVIPGLANVHGRLAFNAAAFILQAPYAFTNIVGQSLYPVNGVLISLFLFWLLTRILKNKSTYLGIIYLVLFYLLARTLLMDMSSPSSDPLELICIAYVVIKYFDAFSTNQISASAILLPLVISLFAIEAKLSAFPVLLTVPIALYLLRKNNKIWALVLKLIFIFLPLYTTWLARNIILSGYLAYPLPWPDIFHVDWKAPKDVLMLDYIYVKHQPKAFLGSYEYLKSMPFPKWLPPWLSYIVHVRFFVELATLIGCFFSPFYWIVIYIRRKQISWPVFFLWLALYIGVWWWLINSPDVRFGIGFMSLSATLPFLYWITVAKQQRKYKVINWAMLLFLFALAYNQVRPPRIPDSMYAFSLKDCWLYPLKDKRYYYKNNKADFKYSVLNNGIKLYQEDSTHECLNADLPCMEWQYGKVQSRGPKMEDGFKNVADSVRYYYPFVK